MSQWWDDYTLVATPQSNFLVSIPPASVVAAESFSGPLQWRAQQMWFDRQRMCDCGAIHTVSHIINSCQLTQFDGATVT